MERLNKYLANSGVTSRRQADLLIREGKVTVNGNVVDSMGFQVNPDLDVVAVNGSPVNRDVGFQYLILYKPPGFLSTVSDPFRRPTVMDLLPETGARLYPVGRLDLDTSGLLFFTNDGDMALALTHPKHLVKKTYLAKLDGIPTNEEIQRLSKGIMLEDGITAPAEIRVEKIENGNAIVKVILHEGRKRQVKRMMQVIGHPVISLHRVAMGPLTLGTLKPGESRKPTTQELQALYDLKQKLAKLR